MRVLSVWSSGKSDTFVAGGKLDIEGNDKCVDKVIAGGGDAEGDLESQVLHFDGVDVYRLDGNGQTSVVDGGRGDSR